MTENPLLDAWRESYGPDAALSWNGRLGQPGRAPGQFVDNYRLRSKLIKLYAFAVPSDEALDLVASLSPIVEIGAGTGYWARLLRASGADVLAYDELGEAFTEWFPGTVPEGVGVGGIEKAGEHADRTLLLVWPPYDSPMATETLATYRDAGGERVVYVGEMGGGCCADNEFFVMLGEDCYNYDDEHDHTNDPRPDWQEVHSLTIPQWEGMHDYLTVYERSKEGGT